MKASISVRGRVAASEEQVPDAELEKWIVSWPGRVPKAARGNGRAAAANQKERVRGKDVPYAARRKS